MEIHVVLLKFVRLLNPFVKQNPQILTAFIFHCNFFISLSKAAQQSPFFVLIFFQLNLNNCDYYFVVPNLTLYLLSYLIKRYFYSAKPK